MELPASSHYELGKIIGEGAYGTVYQAVDKHNHRLVAIKCFLRRQARWWRQETEALTRLSHPNILKFVSAFETLKYCFLVTELVNGHDLIDYMGKRQAALGPKQILDIMLQICSAAFYMKSKNMCHHDLKPENIMIDENDHITIIDFGFSRERDYKDCVGSLPSSAPEVLGFQGENKLLKIKDYSYFTNGPAPHDGCISDVWSMGVLVYCMAHNKYPFWIDPPIDNNKEKKHEAYGNIDGPATVKAIISGDCKVSSDCHETIKRLLKNTLVVDPAKRITTEHLYSLVERERRKFLLEETKNVEQFPTSSTSLGGSPEVFLHFDDNDKLGEHSISKHIHVAVKKSPLNSTPISKVISAPLDNLVPKPKSIYTTRKPTRGFLSYLFRCFFHCKKKQENH